MKVICKTKIPLTELDSNICNGGVRKKKDHAFESEKSKLSHLAKAIPFSLSTPYSKTEAVPLIVNKNAIRLYPTKKVMESLDKVKIDKLDLNLELTNLFNTGYLKIAEDTTVYYPKEFAELKKIGVANNRLCRFNQELEPKTYIFVLSNQNELFATTKQVKAPHGRVHHSSLVRGEPVNAGGMMRITKNADHTRRILITNESGHYKPSPESVDRVVNWLNEHGLQFQVESDATKDSPLGKVRSIVLKTNSTFANVMQ
jgi:hypothetical protein